MILTWSPLKKSLHLSEPSAQSEVSQFKVGGGRHVLVVCGMVCMESLDVLHERVRLNADDLGWRYQSGRRQPFWPKRLAAMRKWSSAKQKGQKSF